MVNLLQAVGPPVHEHRDFTGSPVLPRGTRIKVGTVGPLEKILFGPATVTDGSQNLMGALRQSMAALGARTIREMQQVEIVYAPAVPSSPSPTSASPTARRPRSSRPIGSMPSR